MTQEQNSAISAPCQNPACICHGRSNAPACAHLMRSGGLKQIDGEQRHIGIQYFCTKAKGHDGPCYSCGLPEPEKSCQEIILAP